MRLKDTYKEGAGNEEFPYTIVDDKNFDDIPLFSFKNFEDAVKAEAKILSEREEGNRFIQIRGMTDEDYDTYESLSERAFNLISNM